MNSETMGNFFWDTLYILLMMFSYSIQGIKNKPLILILWKSLTLKCTLNCSNCNQLRFYLEQLFSVFNHHCWQKRLSKTPKMLDCLKARVSCDCSIIWAYPSCIIHTNLLSYSNDWSMHYWTVQTIQNNITFT